MYWLPYSSHTSHHPSQTLCLLWISYATQKLMIDSYKMVEKQSIRSVASFFLSLKRNSIAYHSSKVSPRPDCIFEIHQLWQSDFSRVYSNSCCGCSLEPEIIKIGQSSHKIYSNNIGNFQESTTNLNAHTKKSLDTYWMHHLKRNRPQQLQTHEVLSVDVENNNGTNKGGDSIFANKPKRKNRKARSTIHDWHILM